MIYVSNPLQDTWVVSILLCTALLLSLRRKKDKQLFPVSITQELKGFAIFAIIFAHIGYSLSVDPKFLWPLSSMAGVGVNLFLFLSGYGLTSSNLKRKLNIRQFYSRRLKKLYLPFWIVLSFYFLLDFFVLQRNYPVEYIGKAFSGIFQSADAINDINSPLWYFTLIAFYYLIYPLAFIKKQPWLSAAIIFACSSLLLQYSPLGSSSAARLYQVYLAAFPLGMVAAWLHNSKYKLPVPFRTVIIPANKLVRNSLHYASMLSLLLIIGYSAYYSGAGDSPQKEQVINVLTMLGLVIFFILKRVEMKLFYIFGIYSYEIYLLHWPLLSRYDVIFSHSPAWLAVALYLIVFLILGWILNKLPALFGKYLATNHFWLSAVRKP